MSAEVTAEAGAGAGLERAWRPSFPLDLGRTIGPLRRGPGDPAMRRDGGGAVWWASTTPAGPATLTLRRAADGEVRARAWGPGAAWVLDGLPGLLGSGDDDTGFVAHHPVVAQARHQLTGTRLGACGRVWDVLLAAILEQKVTGVEAWRSWRELARRFGEPAPGPAPEGMRVPPTPEAVRAVPDWEWHLAGVDRQHRRAILACASVAHRLERAVGLRGEPGRALLRTVPGVGIWTAAEVAQRAWGDPDAVSVGDFHIPGLVGWNLLGRPVDDAGMLELLAPYAPQRQRVVRYLEAAGARPPRRGPRFSPKDYRGM